MTRKSFALALLVVAPSLARAQGSAEAAEAARLAVRQALAERLPVPSHPPALPDRTQSPARLPGSQFAAREQAERAARAHAAGAREHPRQRGAPGSRPAAGAAGEPMGDHMEQHGGDHMDPADMMRSRGTMPGGGPMPMQPPSTPPTPGQPTPGMPHGG